MPYWSLRSDRSFSKSLIENPTMSFDDDEYGDVYFYDMVPPRDEVKLQSNGFSQSEAAEYLATVAVPGQIVTLSCENGLEYTGIVLTAGIKDNAGAVQQIVEVTMRPMTVLTPD